VRLAIFAVFRYLSRDQAGSRPRASKTCSMAEFAVCTVVIGVSRTHRR
jgi:hypothetical protein